MAIWVEKESSGDRAQVCWLQAWVTGKVRHREKGRGRRRLVDEAGATGQLAVRVWAILEGRSDGVCRVHGRFEQKSDVCSLSPDRHTPTALTFWYASGVGVPACRKQGEGATSRRGKEPKKGRIRRLLGRHVSRRVAVRRGLAETAGRTGRRPLLLFRAVRCWMRDKHSSEAVVAFGTEGPRILR
ncbi:hypothetical protein CMQ_30 [Grosmannia clavigera kw1407]|uniref:Uncharacterized protein n=1 Tax=Grosmannia clavigera (strain kw1407 / UAMH 11150) TaxID=655863 RepID=F0XR39_GROCL|nr:uncharacterized protein CMQ_30 [Grosmannia clavigera kw1407]EFW99712.1 hypothetical protein CMQ_30 [Grosmannia clavigera kw1407]